ncbi:Beta-galactosidase 11 [Hibiscus syriacus]|uniref:Beta-galactosidase n=2 Tax=Hibiscus syriacus TaxID=106335 RepID=A0A6A2X4D0_HIBSY|nr:Beta-galactosidase 11 [Hibiscus syriacus]
MSISKRILLVTFLSTLLIASRFAQGNNTTDGGEEEEEDGSADEEVKVANANTGVTYDGRSLIINGKRELVFSGSIHYPRCPPEYWEDLIGKAKRGGLNAIETYVFWNGHEPEKGKYYFEGDYDLIKFIKLIHKHKMFAIVRFGPFVQAEWNHGGLPYWLREVPGIIFRSDNEPFKHYMKKFVTMIVDKLKGEKLFASQGGPIIVAQIENEYNTIQLAFREKGESYIQWVAKTAVDMNIGVPWMMCKQKDAPDPIINSCNGRHCGDTFVGPNKPNKPYLWTENWTAQYRVFGDPPSQRSTEDLAYSILRWFSKNGTLANYYMYYGGTNYNRTSAAFVSTRYYDEAPIDEYALIREPKHGHLKDAHRAVSLCKKALLSGTPLVEKLGPKLEARVWQVPDTAICAAFLANNDTSTPATVRFKGGEYYLPANSISVLPDCKTMVYSSHLITAQHNSRNMERSKVANNFEWKMYKESLPTQFKNKANQPVEFYYLTKDITDYAWYSTTFPLSERDMPLKKDVRPIIRIASEGHGIYVFVNGEYIGFGHGSKVEKNFVFQRDANFKTGKNTIHLLCYTVGFHDSGAYLERRYAGPRSVTILGLNTGTVDISMIGWETLVGIEGEKKQIYTEKGSQSVHWATLTGDKPPITWYKAYFDAPEGNNPIAIRMTNMGKGMVWINGRSIGRYWMSYLSALKQPTQSEYHIPRTYIKPEKNLIVVFEEEGGNPMEIEIVLVDRNTICSLVSEKHTPSPRLFKSVNGNLRAKSNELKPKAKLVCPKEKKIVSVDFASFGDPYGTCGNFFFGNCTSTVSKQVVEKFCLGKPDCTVPVDKGHFGGQNDACSNLKKKLAVQAQCG